MQALIPFLLRNWQGALGVLAAAVLVTLLVIRTDQRDAARRDLRDCRNNHSLFVARSAAEANRLRAEFEAKARETQANQTRISQETSREYQARLAALRSDYERRLRAHNGGSGQPGAPGVSPVPGAPGGPDAGTPPSAPDEFACEANTLQLEYLQRWAREQLEADRRLHERADSATQ